MAFAQPANRLCCRPESRKAFSLREVVPNRSGNS
jgi:hypothetical protein